VKGLLKRALGGRRAEPAPRLSPEAEIAAQAFDARFYLSINTDVAASGSDPLEHFMVFGWKEGRDPAPDFSVKAYLAAFPEVAAAGENPFVHWLASGRPKVFPPEPPLGFRYEVIAGLVPVADRIARVTKGEDRLSDAADLAAALQVSRGGLSRLHVTFSHDDFTANVGGLQLSIQREAARLAEQGRDHLHLHPARPWPVVRKKAERGALGVVWNGRPVGLFAPATVREALAAAAAGDASGRSFAIHSLLGHAPEETADILAAAGLKAGVFWLHDFASVCAGFHLLRDDVEDCAGPPPDSAACNVCVYGPWRGRHVEAHARLFRRLKLTVAAPSQVTLDLWRRASGLKPAATAVAPHATLTPLGPAPLAPADRPFRLAYAGLPVAHKGWPIFRTLAGRFSRDPRYEFIHLGLRRDREAPIAFQEVAAGPDNPFAMRDALAAAEPDAVLVWPLCRETFSFVAYEAVAAGAAILTGPDSGNVQAFVTETGHGRVLPNEAALTAAFESGEVLALARAQRRPMLHELSFSALSLDLPAGPRP
jgi:hypothetical protein